MVVYPLRLGVRIAEALDDGVMFPIATPSQWLGPGSVGALLSGAVLLRASLLEVVYIVQEVAGLAAINPLDADSLVVL